MKSLRIIKNTLPYIHPYSLIDESGKVIAQFKSLAQAEKAKEKIINSSKTSNIKIESKDTKIIKDPIDCLEKRMNNPVCDDVKVNIPYKRKIVINKKEAKDEE